MTIHVVEFAPKPDLELARDVSTIVERLHELITQVEAGAVDAVFLVTVKQSEPCDLSMFVSAVPHSGVRANDILASIVLLQSWYVSRSFGN